MFHAYRNIYFYEIAINVMETIRKIFSLTIADDLSYIVHELHLWHDNVAFLKNELKNCEVCYVIFFILYNFMRAR